MSDAETNHQTAHGTVRNWDDDEGWGVLDAPQTPGGCWAHFSAVTMPGFRSLGAGERVRFVYETPGQDGFDYRAVAVYPVGVEAGTGNDFVHEVLVNARAGGSGTP